MWRLSFNSISVTKKAEQHNLTEIIKKLAKNKEIDFESGISTKMHFLSRYNIRADNYFQWAEYLYDIEVYYNSLKFLLKAITYKPYSFKLLNFLFVKFLYRAIHKFIKIIRRKTYLLVCQR